MAGAEKKTKNLAYLGIRDTVKQCWNLTPPELIEKTIIDGAGTLTDTGALAVDTGEFTGRSPKDRFIVRDRITDNTVNWGEINTPFEPEKFDALYDKVIHYLNSQAKPVYVRDCYACAEPEYRLNIRVVTELPWQNLFVHNLFLRPGRDELENFTPQWHVIAAPGFHADPQQDGTRQHNFAIINFSRKIILIGGTAYTGEIKKGIFSVLNFLLPHEEGVLSMHCSANMGSKGDTAIFFGLSGTGKTTLSADPKRQLIGDDEHGWWDGGVFNFEGGCYAKCINLSPEGEPQIYNAIRFGTLLENTRYFEGTRTVNYADSSVTENTRAAYPIHFIDNARIPSVGTIPTHIFFLTCDAFGVLPPISKLDKGQAMFQFISGYTAKVAGTEAGITEPKTTFSACFGAPFLPLHPAVYARMLGERMKQHQVKVWLVNTGWSGGGYGQGSRIKLAYTRSMIDAALSGMLDNVEYQEHPVFKLQMPLHCPGVPDEILNPVNTWADKDAYFESASKLAKAFQKNFEKYESLADEELKTVVHSIAVDVHH